MVININGAIEFVECESDILKLVDDNMGNGAREAIEKYIKKSSENEGDNYELIADGYSRALQNSLAYTMDIIKYVKESKRIDRKELIAMLEEIENEITNEV